jgi:hypothetical protein
MKLFPLPLPVFLQAPHFASHCEELPSVASAVAQNGVFAAKSWPLASGLGVLDGFKNLCLKFGIGKMLGKDIFSKT